MDLKMLGWAARRGLGLKGDFVACGVGNGDVAWAITEAVDLSAAGKSFLLFGGRPGERFAGKPYVKVIRGAVPDSAPDAIAFLHIDMRAEQPGILEALFDRVSPSAAIVLDGYGHAADAFVRSRGHDILGQPTGQGLVVKRP